MNEKFTRLSAFDLDHTLMTSNCSFRFGVYLYRQGYFSWATMLYLVACYAAHCIGALSVSTLHYKLFYKIFYQRPYEIIRAHVHSFLDQSLESTLYLPAITALNEAKKNGHFTMILSTSPHFLVEAVAQRLKVDAWEATTYLVGDDHCFQNIVSVFEGMNKAKYLDDFSLKFQIRKEDIYAYSDSHLDLPFLKVAGNPVAVRPNKTLRAFCKKNGWKVI
jgi:HAD superfamily hydrolase (TIGR01490 family)